MTEEQEITRLELTEQLRRLGVRAGGVLLVHCAFRAVRPIEGGPPGLIAALREALGPEGTLVLPSWTGEDDSVFDPRTSAASFDLGVLADLFWREPGVVRSDHAEAFAAIGPHARFIVGGPLPMPPHIPDSPVGRVFELNGQILLLGVGHDANTSLHLAELMAGVQYRSPTFLTVLKDGEPVRISFGENNHCCARFALADDWLRAKGQQSEGLVGHAHARLMAARDVVLVACEHLRSDLTLFLHARGDGCRDCDEARDSIPLSGEPRATPAR